VLTPADNNKTKQPTSTTIYNQQPSNQINNHNSICAGLMEGRFPDSLLNELRSALQNQCVFGLCRFLSAGVDVFLNRSPPSIVDYFEKHEKDLPKQRFENS
jgi:hypothetical protein